MISYKVKGIILAVIISLASIMMPFSVYADTITTSNITYNYYLTDVVDSTSQLANKNYIYDVDFIFDKSYLGWVSVSMITSYIYETGDIRQATYTKAIYVNGNTAKTSIVISSNFTGTNGSPLSSMSITINNSNVTPLADLSSLQDIIDLLLEIDDHISINVLDELENIVSNTSLANEYLETLTKMRVFDIPIESYSLNMYSLYYPRDIYSYMDLYEFSYPIFSIPSNGDLYKFPSRINGEFSSYTFVLGFANNFAVNNIGSYISVDDGTISDVSILYRMYLSNDTLSTAQSFQFFKFTVSGFTSSKNDNKIYSKRSSKFILIYGGLTDFNYISTDFALRWGLSNQLLNDIHIIAQGNVQSNSAASDLETEASEYSEIADDVIGVEEGLTSNFETSVNQIDLNTGLNGFGGNFMTSATWVRTQFDRLTENTPYGSLVVYGLTLGFVLLMLGKVLL